MKTILTTKAYNAFYENRKALTDNGKIRETGYVLLDTNTDERKWFPNMSMAKIERDSPGKYGERGIKI